MRLKEILIKSEEIKDPNFCRKLYSNLCNLAWYDYIGDEIISFSWRGAGSFVAEVRNESLNLKEDYIDWYLSGKEGELDPEIEEFMNRNGIVLFKDYYDYVSDTPDDDRIKYLKKTDPILISHLRDKKIDTLI